VIDAPRCRDLNDGFDPCDRFGGPWTAAACPEVLSKAFCGVAAMALISGEPLRLRAWHRPFDYETATGGIGSN
jgi:hypothetical protein